MMVEMIAGPVPPECAVPEFEGIEQFVRQPRPGEAPTKACCSVCSGAGVVLRYRRGVRDAETCRRCSGTGKVEGVPLVRLAAPPGDPQFASFGGWARDAGLRVESGLRLRETGGANGEHSGSALVWSDFRGNPLRERGGHFVATRALGIAVEANGRIDAHVAAHVATVDGRVAIVGLWDVAGARKDGLRADWSETGSSAIVGHWRLRFPLAALEAALDRAACRRCRHTHFGPGCGAAPHAGVTRSNPYPAVRC